MARVEGFTYGTHVIGGAAPTSNTQVVGERFGWDFDASEDDESAEFVCEFIVVGTSRADLESKCVTVLSALRTKYEKLSVDWGSTNVVTYEPAVATASGWDGHPRVRKSRRKTRSVGFVRGFEFRLRVEIPSNYTDPNLPSNPAANGRRTSSVNLRWDAGARRVVTIEGKYHMTAAQLPRAKTATAALNNPTGPIDTYCVARLAKIDAAAQWTLAARDERDNNQLTSLVFRREYYETIAGRFVATPRVNYLPSRQRLVTIRGTFFRTYSATYDGTPTRSARTNYLDASTGGYAYAVTQLAALTAAQGGALTVGTDCELIGEDAQPNDQDDRLDYTLVFREIIFQQSRVANSKDDPEIVLDSILYGIEHVPLDDSPVAPGGGSTSAPNPFKPSPGAGSGGAASKPQGTTNPYTGSLDKSVVPPENPLGGNGPGTVSGQLPTKPVILRIEYKATISRTVSDLKAKWTNDILPWLSGQFPAELGYAPTYLLRHEFQENAESNTIAAQVVALALPGDLIAYNLEEAVDDQLGLEADGAYTGIPHEYFVQQSLPMRKKVRRHTAFFKTGGSFDPSILLTQTQIPGYMVVRRSAPRINTKTVGIPGFGVATVTLTGVSFVEELLYVARNVGAVSSGVPNGAPTSGQPNNATVTFAGLGVNPVPPSNPGGV